MNNQSSIHHEYASFLLNWSAIDLIGGREEESLMAIPEFGFKKFPFPLADMC